MKQREEDDEAIMGQNSPASADLADTLALILGSLDPILPLRPRLPPAHRPLLVFHHLHHWI